MQNIKEIGGKKEVLLSVLLGCAIALVATLVFVVIFAYLMTLFSISPKVSGTLSTLSYVLGCFFGGLFTGNKTKSKGIVNGGACGILVFTFALIVGLVLSQGSITAMTLFHFLGCVLSGCIGGIIAVNRLSSKKYKIGKIK